MIFVVHHTLLLRALMAFLLSSLRMHKSQHYHGRTQKQVETNNLKPLLTINTQEHYVLLSNGYPEISLIHVMIFEKNLL